MFPTAARASEVRKYFIIWYSDLTCLFWICLLNDNFINLLKFIGGELHSVLLHDKWTRFELLDFILSWGQPYYDKLMTESEFSNNKYKQLIKILNRTCANSLLIIRVEFCFVFLFYSQLK